MHSMNRSGKYKQKSKFLFAFVFDYVLYRALLEDSNYYLTATEPVSSVVPGGEVTTSYDLKHQPASKNIFVGIFLPQEKQLRVISPACKDALKDKKIFNK